MAQMQTAESVFRELKQLPAAERQRFFAIVAQNAFRSEDLTHEEVFGHLATEQFTAQEAADYLGVSMSTFRRYVASGRLAPVATVGRNDLFAAPALKAFKRALKQAKGG